MNVTTLLLRLLLITMTSRTAAHLNAVLLNYARDLATRTDTPIDDAIVELLRKFAALPDRSARDA